MLLVSQTEADAVELLGKVQFIFDSLPDLLRPEEKHNLRCLMFPGCTPRWWRCPRRGGRVAGGRRGW